MAPLVGSAAASAAAAFASGGMLLAGDSLPLLPALLQMTGDSTARVSICEGRYHQVCVPARGPYHTQGRARLRYSDGFTGCARCATRGNCLAQAVAYLCLWSMPQLGRKYTAGNIRF